MCNSNPSRQFLTLRFNIPRLFRSFTKGQKTVKDIDREQVIAEVLELGEMLFDTVIDAVEHQPVAEKASDASLIEEMRAAANEFFTAVRLLLETEQETDKQNP
jgi:hypothetical protein